MTSTMTASLSTDKAFRGLYALVAKQLELDTSYVSRVANGQRRNEKVLQAIEAELNSIVKARRQAKAKLSAT